MTDVIAERAADAAGASVYVVRHPDRYPHHLSSALFTRQSPTRLAEFLDHVDVAVSLHGYGRIGRSTQLLAGGRNRALAAHLARHVELTGLSGRHRPRRDPARTARPAPATTRSTGCAAAAPSWNCRRGSGASARAARCRVTTVCRRSPAP